MHALGHVGLREGFGTQLDAEQAAVQQPLAQQGKHAVLVVPPRLHGHKNVAVVQFTETFEDVGVGQEFGPVEVVVQEQRQRGGGEHGNPLTCEVLGAVEDQHEHVLGAQDGSVQVHLPVHQATRHNELLNGVDRLLFDAELAVHDVQHLQDALAAHLALGDPAVEAVPSEVIQAVHVELAADQLMEERLGMVVVEDFNGQIQGAPHLVVQAAHDQGADVFVVHAFHNAVFQRMTERAVTHVVQEDCQARRLGLRLGDGYALVAQAVDGLLHEVHAAHGMVKAVVNRPRVDQVGEAQLRNASQALHVPVVHQVEGPLVAQGHKPIDGVVENFVAVDRAHSNTKSRVSTLLCRQARFTARDAARYAPGRCLETGQALECELRWDDHTFFGLTTKSNC